MILYECLLQSEIRFGNSELCQGRWHEDLTLQKVIMNLEWAEEWLHAIICEDSVKPYAQVILIHPVAYMVGRFDVVHLQYPVDLQ